jgi:hypothetical protein
VERLFARAGGDTELNPNFIGDPVERRPRPLANREIGAAEGELAGEDAGLTLRREGRRDSDVLGLALDR